MSIQRLPSLPARQTEPTATTTRPGNSQGRAQSPFWQMFTAGGTASATPSRPPAAAGPPSPSKTLPPQAAPQAVAAHARISSRVKELPPKSSAAPTTPGRLNQTESAVDSNTTDPIAGVTAALQRLGLNPQQFNLRIDQNPIRFGSRQYDYPLLRADLPTESVGFHLESVMRDPMMTAINIAGMIGRPVMMIPSAS